MLYLAADAPSEYLLHPENLFLQRTSEDVVFETEVRFEAYANYGDEESFAEYYTKVRSREILAATQDDDPNEPGYIINVYTRDQVENFESDNPEDWVVPAAPVSSVEFRHPDEPDYLNIIEVVMRDGGGATQKTYRYEYSDGPGDSWTWTLYEFAAGATEAHRTDEVAWSTDGQGYRVRTKKVWEVGILTLHEVRRYDQSFDQLLLIEKAIDPQGLNRVSTYGHVDTVYGWRPQYVTKPDGGWTYYTYYASGLHAGQLESVITPVGDYAVADLGDVTDVDILRQNGHETRYIYDETDEAELRPIREEEYIQQVPPGTPARVTVYEYTEEIPPGESEPAAVVYEKRCKNPADGEGAWEFLTTKTTYFADDDEQERFVEHPDRCRDEHDGPEFGSYTCTGDPANPTFEPDANGWYQRLTVTHGSLGDPNGGPGWGRQEVRIVDPGGHVVHEKTFGKGWYAGQESWVLTGWATYCYDPDHPGRLLDTYRSDNTHTERIWDCCHLSDIIDGTGEHQGFLYDDLGRVEQRTKYGVAAYGDYPIQPSIVTDIVYGTQGDLSVITETVTGGSETAQTISKHDRIGRLRETIDAASRTTLYEYAFTQDGGRMVTVTHPGGGTEVTEYYRDGRIKRVDGTAVTSRYYEYGVEPDSDQWTMEYVGTTNDTSPRKRKTIYDPLGRVKAEERPAFVEEGGAPNTVVTTYTYDLDDFDHNAEARLALIETSDAGGMLHARTVYEYDITSRELVRTGLDLNGDEVLDCDGTDYVNEMENQYVDDQTWWYESASCTYDPFETRIRTSCQRTQVGSLPAGVTSRVASIDLFEKKSITTTTLDRDNVIVTETTDDPFASADAVRITRNGLLQLGTDSGGLTTRFSYDGLGRRVGVTDSRDNTTTTHYNSLGQVDWVEDGANHRTDYEYYSAAEGGQLKAVKNALDKYTRYDYTDRGEIYRVWGDVPQPVEMAYDDYGQRTTLKTYRGGEDWSDTTWPDGLTGDADTTLWVYDAATGLLTEKEYADGRSVNYTYTAGGRLHERIWARLADPDVPGSNVTTTYQYYTGEYGNGQLERIEYSDDTPDVEFTYWNTGQICTVSDAVGTRAFSYDQDTSGNRVGRTEEFDAASFFPDMVVSQTQRARAYHYGTPSEIQVGTAADPTADYEANYGTHADLGLISKVNSGPGLPGGGSANSPVEYEYLENSRLLEWTKVYEDDTLIASTQRTWEAQRDLLSSVEIMWDTTTVSKYGYVNDELGRRTWATREGAAFTGGSGDHMDNWGYNGRNELTASNRFLGTDPGTPGDAQPGYDREYEYDPIGNRTQVITGDPGDPENPVTSVYTTNRLNQHLFVKATYTDTGQALRYDDDGNLVEMYFAADIDRDGDVDMDDLSALLGAYGLCEGDEDYLPYADLDGDGCVGLSDMSILLGMYGTTIDDEIWALYTWDAENRLIAVEPTAADPGNLTADDKKLVFQYDYMGRRVEKRVIPWNPNLGTEGDWDVDNPDSVRRFVYYNWLPLLELEVENAGTPSETMTILRKYTWGLDLSQTLDGAGGIGGLLATYDTQGTPETTDDLTYLYVHDANGNVGQVLDASDGSIAAKYEYDPYGNNLLDPSDPNESGSYAADNPFRFSTKYWDDETGLGYWGYRYYSPRLGRWISRDPIEITDGPNEYACVYNQVTIAIDPFGLWKIDRADGAQAVSVAEDDDNIQSLAEIIGLNESEWRKWIEFRNLRTVVGVVRSPSHQHPRFSSSTRICPDEEVKIPNTVIAYWGGVFGGFGQFWVLWDQDKASLRKRGFSVLNITNRMAKELEGVIEDEQEARTLHGIVAWGHGGPGHFLTLAAAKGRDDEHHYISYYADWHPRYRMALGVIFACDSATAEEDFADSAGTIFWGKEAMLNPVPPFHLFAPTIEKLVSPGAQGTRK